MTNPIRSLRLVLVVLALLSLSVACRTSHISSEQDTSVQLDLLTPDTSQPDTSQPDTSQPDTSQPDTSTTDAVSDGSEPVDTNLGSDADTALEDQSQPDANTVDTDLPDKTNPPDTAIDFDVVTPDISQGSDPVIEQKGTNGAYLLKGLIVTPDTTLQGQVLVEQKLEADGVTRGVITCVKADCTGMAAAADATVIETNGLIFPGMLDAHNHVLYDVFNETHWSPLDRSDKPGEYWDTHTQWAASSNASYHVMKDVYDYMVSVSNGAGLACEMLKYGELKAIVAGTTSVLGAPIGGTSICYGSLARSIDGSRNGLPKVLHKPASPDADGRIYHNYLCPLLDASPQLNVASNDHIQTSISVPSCEVKDPNVGDTCDDLRENFDTCSTWSYVVHAAEGKHTCPDDDKECNKSMFTEWNNLTEDGLDAQQVTVVHGTALGTEQFQHMLDHGMRLVWSPRSNMSLYGQTTRIDLILELEKSSGKRMTIALGPDWSMGGSVNLLDEMNFVYKYDQAVWGGILTPKRIVEMVTTDAAKALAIDGALGRIEEKYLADLFVLSGDTAQPYLSLVLARPQSVRLVMIDGKVLYGDKSLEDAKSYDNCDTLDICGRQRFLCVALPDTNNKLNQSYQTIVNNINTALTDKQFPSIAPLTNCAP